MRIGNYEFGWSSPLKWHKYWKSDAENTCGCTIYEWGFWYFTILRYDCAGEPDPRVEILDQSVVAAAEPSQLKKLPAEKVKKAKKALKKLNMKVKRKKKK